MKPRVVSEVALPKRDIAGFPIDVVRLVWSDGGESYEVFRADFPGEEGHLTMNGCFDNEPSDGEILALLQGPELWVCPGCGTPCDPGSDVADHVQRCDLVDGAGKKIRPPLPPLV